MYRRRKIIAMNERYYYQSRSGVEKEANFLGKQLEQIGKDNISFSGLSRCNEDQLLIKKGEKKGQIIRINPRRIISFDDIRLLIDNIPGEIEGNFHQSENGRFLAAVTRQLQFGRPKRNFQSFCAQFDRELGVNGEDQSTPSCMNRARKAFRYADIEGKEFLTRHQYKVAMTVLFGHCPDKWDMKRAFARGSNPENLIDFQKFQNSVKSKIDFASKDPVDLESLFCYLDKKFNGYLVMEDFLTAAKDVNLRISVVILKSVFKELDRSGKGLIGIDDLVAMMGDKKR